MENNSRQYELVVFGANGYTGRYTCEHIAEQLPTDLKWAVAGRSEQKLQTLVGDLRALNSDRSQPGIEIAQLDKNSLITLAKKTKVLVSTVGPFFRYGTAVVEACAESGTHYVDCTGESPWVLEMIRKYDQIAKQNKAVLIPQCGVESAPADILTYSLASHARRTLSSGISEIVYTIYDLKSKPSGGTLATVLGLFDHYSPSQFRDSLHPWSMCPASVTPPPANASTHQPSLTERVLGVRTVRDLGVLTTSIQGAADATIVNRSWGLLGSGEYYGPRFQFSPYMRARNILTGALIHFALALGTLSLLLPPVRWALKKMVFQPGEGVSKEVAKRERIEYRAVATSDSSDPADPHRIEGRAAWEGGLYHLTGVLLAEAAIALLRDETLAKKIGGGVLTPATLGGAYVERLQKAGMRIDVRVMP